MKSLLSIFASVARILGPGNRALAIFLVFGAVLVVNVYVRDMEHFQALAAACSTVLSTQDLPGDILSSR